MCFLSVPRENQWTAEGGHYPFSQSSGASVTLLGARSPRFGAASAILLRAHFPMTPSKPQLLPFFQMNRAIQLQTLACLCASIAGYGPCLAATLHLHKHKARTDVCGCSMRTAQCTASDFVPARSCSHETHLERWAGRPATLLRWCTAGSQTQSARKCMPWTRCWASTFGVPHQASDASG